MITEMEAERTVAYFEKMLMANSLVQSISVISRHGLTGKAEFVIEVGVLDASQIDLPNSLPVALEDGTLAARRIPVVVVVVGEIRGL